MKKSTIATICLLMVAASAAAQNASKNGDSFTLALPTHSGKLSWTAEGFTVTQSSAKPNSGEIGVRANDKSGQFNLLGFLFLFPEQAPMSSAKCRDGVMDPLKKSNPAVTVAGASQMSRPDGPPIELVGYVVPGRDGKPIYSMRGFVAEGDICGDLEIYGNDATVISDPNLKKIWESYGLDPKYVPQFNDIFIYAQVLYKTDQYQAAAPIFEQALAKIPQSGDEKTLRRVITDQAGMAYGIAGNVPKARAMFEAAIAKDPDYPMYYYNLACADAEEKKLNDARAHLQQAFARKANMVQGETLPDPTKDDSFLPYRNDKAFWAFLETLH